MTENEYLKRILKKTMENLDEYTRNPSQKFLDEQIIAPLNLIVQSEPNNFHANKFLGLVQFYFNRDIVLGEEYMAKAKLIKPDSSEVSYYLGLINIDKGEPKIAIKHFEDSLRIKVDNLDTLLSLSQVYWDIDEKKKSIDTMDLLEIYKNINQENVQNIDSYDSLKKQIQGYKDVQVDKRGYPEVEYCRLSKEESFISSALLLYFETNPRLLVKQINETKELYFEMISKENSYEENLEFIQELKLFAKVLKNPKKYQLDEETLDKRIDAWLNYNKKIKKQ